MRRRREAQHQARAASGRTSAAPPADGEGEPPPVAGADADAVPSGIDGEAAGSVPADADSGICSGCGKVKPMQRGLIANHQKGLGKFCVGSRKPPA